MNKQDSKLALSVLATLTTGIALIYTLIMYHNFIFAVTGMSILFLIAAFILTQNLIAFSTMKSKSINVHIKDCIDDISAQLEALNGAQSQIGKANYLYTKQTAQVITRLEDCYADSQMTLYKNLSAISDLQSKATRLMIKYDQNNTTKLISTIKDMRNHLNETMIQGFDQIQPNNADVVAVLEDIVAYLKSQPDGMDRELSAQLNNVAHELQNISNNIRQVQTPVHNIIQEEPASISTTNISETEEAAIAPAGTDTLTDEFISTASDLDMLIEETINPSGETDTYTTEEADISAADTSTEESIGTATEAVPETTAASVSEKDLFTPTFTVVGKSSQDEMSKDDSNKQLSPDEIAALFASVEPAPKKAEAIAEEERKMDEVIAQAVPQTSSTAPASDTSNKKLSPDEIAALFAQMG